MAKKTVVYEDETPTELVYRLNGEKKPRNIWFERESQAKAYAKMLKNPIYVYFNYIILWDAHSKEVENVKLLDVH